jgi:5-formyltetrahydrofolate cyclo-ligase
MPRHDRDAGGPADVLAAKAELRQEVWSAMSAARVARFLGAAGRIPWPVHRRNPSRTARSRDH